MSNRRLFIFGLALLIAAAPLFWFDLDPRAGERLLHLTSTSKTTNGQHR